MNPKINMLSKSIKMILASSITASVFASAAVSAQETPDAAEGESIEQIAVIGSRGAPRSVSDSPVPIDVIGGDELGKTGTTDVLDQLVGAIPSFNAHTQPISDAATLVRPINLRGLPSDSTLILLNGKRRHRASVIAFQGGGLNDGAQGPDISAIPGIALKQVEVLRDGAAAQYGSDAIAGVMNFVLKDDSEGGSLTVKSGEYFDGGGQATTFSGNVGMPLTTDGFVNLSFQYKNSDATSRSYQRNDAATIAAAGNSSILSPAQIWGSPDIDDDITLFGNVGLDLGDDKEFYMWGNYSERDVLGGFYFRNPHTRGSVFSNDGGETLLVADLDGVGQGIECPTIPITTNNVLGQADYQLIADNSTALGANCYAVNEMYPGGYTPNFGGTVTDSSLTIGTKGEFKSGWLEEVRYDITGSVGRNEAKFILVNTQNGSMGPESPNDFNPGTYIQLEKNFNFDLVKDIEAGLEEPVTVAGGVEFREESFTIVAGDEASWTAGPYVDQGFNVGSHGFPGFQPSQAGEFVRRNKAAYLDVTSYMTENFMMQGALRYEDYDSFGDTTNFKVTGQYQLTEDLSLRGSVSTGFRAPTVGQSNVSNVSTALEDGQLIDSALLPPTSEFSKLFGGRELDPEESRSKTIGLVYDNGDFFLTADYYNIEVTDRLSQSERRTISEAQYQELEAIGVPNARSVGTVSFFTNDFDTTTEGLDVVANVSADHFGGATKYALAYNYTSTEVDSFSDITGDFKVRRLEEGLPEHRASFTINQDWENVSAVLRANYYGEYFAVHADWGAQSRDVSSDVTIDLEINYHLGESLVFTAGASNLFNEYPEAPPREADLGALYYETSPFGFNGGFYYFKAAYNF